MRSGQRVLGCLSGHLHVFTGIGHEDTGHDMFGREKVLDLR